MGGQAPAPTHCWYMLMMQTLPSCSRSGPGLCWGCCRRRDGRADHVCYVMAIVRVTLYVGFQVGQKRGKSVSFGHQTPGLGA